jgi:hypothetical protein
MNNELLFERLFIDSELADTICSEFGINRKELSLYAEKTDKEQKTEIIEIKRVRTLFHNKKELEGFSFPSFNLFYKWHKSQHAKQDGKCYYCKTEEHIISKLFEVKYRNRKRLNRGNHLEVERRDSTTNLYDKDNCVLACYFCNNDKSDIFTESEYLKYLNNRTQFLNEEFNKLND